MNKVLVFFVFVFAFFLLGTLALPKPVQAQQAQTGSCIPPFCCTYWECNADRCGTTHDACSNTGPKCCFYQGPCQEEPTNPPPPPSEPPTQPPPSLPPTLTPIYTPTASPTPTKPPACNQPCNPSDNKCPVEGVPPEGGCPICAPNPVGPTPGQEYVCQPPSPTPTTQPTATPTPRPPAKCKCDHIDFQIAGKALNEVPMKKGDNVTFTVYGTVDPNDPAGNDAEIFQMRFRFQRRNGSGGWDDIASEMRPATQVDNLGSSIRKYAATWVYVMPQEGGTYRVIVQTTAEDFMCRYRNTQADAGTMRVLATSDTNQSFFQRLLNFLGQFFTRQPKTETQTANEPQLTIVAPTNARSLQLGTFSATNTPPPSPTPYLEKGCTWVGFSL